MLITHVSDKITHVLPNLLNFENYVEWFQENESAKPTTEIFN